MKNKTHSTFNAPLKSSPILEEAFKGFVRCRQEQHKGSTKQLGLHPHIINGYFSSSEFCNDFTESGFAFVPALPSSDLILAAFH